MLAALGPGSPSGSRAGSASSYRCGQASAKALDAFLAASQPLRCEYVERDRYGRFVGDCFRADGESVPAWLVLRGHALDWPRFSKGEYAAQEAEAKRLKAGMWQGEFVPPWEWRAAQRSPQTALAASAPASGQQCAIKGNINRKGECSLSGVPGQV